MLIARFDAAELEQRWSAHNYDPLPVTLVAGEGAWVTGDDGTRYLDLLSSYSALNFGHRHPRLVAAAHAQLDRLTLTSRAFRNDQLGPFCAELAELVGMDGVLPANTGAEAVETAIKAARRWAYERRGVPSERATVIVADGNFHGRTTTIVRFSSDPDARRGFGPFTPGFVRVPFGDLDAVAAEVNGDTAAVLVEPVQGEAGVIVPPEGYLRGLRRLCDERGVLLVLDVFTPGSHGSTFGGNPLACAIGREVIALLRTGEPQQQAASLGGVLREELAGFGPRLAGAVRTAGLWAGVDLAGPLPPARVACEALLSRRVLVKDTHHRALRIAPPFVVTAGELRWAVGEIRAVLEELCP